jgi:hypothetical protein
VAASFAAPDVQQPHGHPGLYRSEHKTPRCAALLGKLAVPHHGRPFISVGVPGKAVKDSFDAGGQALVFGVIDKVLPTIPPVIEGIILAGAFLMIALRCAVCYMNH